MRSESTVAVVIGVLSCGVILSLACYSTYLVKTEQKDIPKWSPRDNVFPSASWYRQCVFQGCSLCTIICLCFFQITTHKHSWLFPYISALSMNALLTIMSWQSACSVNPFYKMKGGHNWFGYKVALLISLCLFICQILLMIDQLTPAHWMGLSLAFYTFGESICTSQYLAFCFRYLTADSIYSGGVGVFYVFFVRALFKIISRMSRLLSICLFIALYYGGSNISKNVMWSVCFPCVISGFNIDHYFLSKRNRPNCKQGDCYGLGDKKQDWMQRWFQSRYDRYRLKKPYGAPNDPAPPATISSAAGGSGSGSNNERSASEETAEDEVLTQSPFEIKHKPSLIDE